MQDNKENIQQLAQRWSQLSVHSFEQLADFIRDTHYVAQSIASRAINRSLTLRNWLVGYYMGSKSTTVSHQSGKSEAALQKFTTPADKLINNLSFSHIREIMTQSDPLARFFYETESIRGGWSVRELRRQITTIKERL